MKGTYYSEGWEHLATHPDTSCYTQKHLQSKCETGSKKCHSTWEWISLYIHTASHYIHTSSHTPPSSQTSLLRPAQPTHLAHETNPPPPVSHCQAIAVYCCVLDVLATHPSPANSSTPDCVLSVCYCCCRDNAPLCHACPEPPVLCGPPVAV